MSAGDPSFRLHGPALPLSPVILSVPHAGRDYPLPLRAALRVTERAGDGDARALSLPAALRVRSTAVGEALPERGAESLCVALAAAVAAPVRLPLAAALPVALPLAVAQPLREPRGAEGVPAAPPAEAEGQREGAGVAEALVERAAEGDAELLRAGVAEPRADTEREGGAVCDADALTR